MVFGKASIVERQDGPFCKLADAVDLPEAAHEFYRRFDNGDYCDLRRKKGD